MLTLACPMAVRRSSLMVVTRTIASVRSRGLRGGTRKPLYLSRTRSSHAPHDVVQMTGRPEAVASWMTVPQGSRLLGSTKQAAPAKTDGMALGCSNPLATTPSAPATRPASGPVPTIRRGHGSSTWSRYAA
jgi:hypothetical protein